MGDRTWRTWSCTAGATAGPLPAPETEDVAAGAVCGLTPPTAVAGNEVGVPSGAAGAAGWVRPAPAGPAAAEPSGEAARALPGPAVPADGAVASVPVPPVPPPPVPALPRIPAPVDPERV